MLKADVVAYFDDSPTKVARKLGISRSAVNQWRALVPLKWALKLDALTNGKLKADMDAYELSEISVRTLSEKRRHASV